MAHRILPTCAIQSRQYRMTRHTHGKAIRTGNAGHRDEIYSRQRHETLFDSGRHAEARHALFVAPTASDCRSYSLFSR